MLNYNRVEKIQASLAKLQSEMSSTVVKFDEGEARDAQGRWTSGDAASLTHDELLNRHDRVTGSIADRGGKLQASALGIIRQSLEAAGQAKAVGDAAHSIGDYHHAAEKHAEAVNHYRDAQFGYNHMADVYAKSADTSSDSQQKAELTNIANSLMNMEFGADSMATNVELANDYDLKHDFQVVKLLVDVEQRKKFIAARLDRVLKGFNIEQHEASATEASDIPAENIVWLNNQIKSGGHAAVVAENIIESLTMEKARRFPVQSAPQYSLPDEMRARKHNFFPTEEVADEQ
jgi:hypothetical protein